MQSLVLWLPLYSVWCPRVSIRRNLSGLLWGGCSLLFCPPSSMKQYEISLSISVLLFPLKCPTLRSHHLATLCMSPVASHGFSSHTGIAEPSHELGLSLFTGQTTHFFSFTALFIVLSRQVTSFLENIVLVFLPLYSWIDSFEHRTT